MNHEKSVVAGLFAKGYMETAYNIAKDPVKVCEELPYRFEDYWEFKSIEFLNGQQIEDDAEFLAALEVERRENDN